MTVYPSGHTEGEQNSQQKTVANHNNKRVINNLIINLYSNKQNSTFPICEKTTPTELSN